MSEHIRKTIADLQLHLKSLEDEAADAKRTINSLCKAMGEKPMYSNTDAKSVMASGPVRRDQYYGKALASVAREVLEARQAMNLGPATVAEMYDKMVEGGYVFETSNADNATRALRISLTKNTSTFHKLPGGAYGLLEWYPAVRTQRRAKVTDTDLEDEADADVPDESAVDDGVAAAQSNGELAAALPTRKPR